MMYEDDEEAQDQSLARPWIVLKTTYDVEAWIDHQNRNIQYLIKGNKNNGWGICFELTEGGEIYMHTTSEGDVLLDVTPEAEWVAPLITAVTQVDAPRSQIWALPGDKLTQLVLGLSPLLAMTRLVTDHSFNLKKY
ncbi:MAG: hypothetical protein K2Y13_02310 [Burkholderiaceae bacterium]|uniref:SCP2 domain-containing protein n=1 Tax=Herminiimonas contaminans TaxID=1111140 RepID=A0ABS0EUU1_9BURK|nr:MULTISPECIES: hypothetical protein [Oxalobacteraceae]MBF8178617.1 hypothetical protein [Herminiimonas contaminans]MBX9798271.1 hypothetical protein [Burkholderiaceae bacterium]